MEQRASPWRRASAEMLVDKQPSVAITIQKEYSNFSGINLSFLTHGNQSDCSKCIHLHPSHTPGRLQRFDFIIDPAVAPRGGRGDPESRPRRRDGVQRERGSIQVELLVAALQKHCAALWSTSTWKHLSGWSPTPHGKPSRANAESVIRDSFNHRPVSMSVDRQHSYCGVFLLNPHYIPTFSVMDPAVTSVQLTSLKEHQVIKSVFTSVLFIYY